MTSSRLILSLLVGFLGLVAIVPEARADSFGFYNTGSFQYDSTTISGNAEGTCEGQCAPWGSIVILDVSFDAAITNYQQNESCANGECETEISGRFGPGSVAAEVSVFGDSSGTYYLDSSLLQGTFSSHFCTGHCGTYRAESELSVDFQGLWNNDWYSTGIIQMECFHNEGCSDGTGAGSLTTATPEPSVVVLLLGEVPVLYFAIRKKLA